MSDTKDDAGPNSLGLDLKSLSIDDTTRDQATPDAESKPSEGGVKPEEGSPSADQAETQDDASHEDKPESAKGDAKRPPKVEKKTPYVNPDRVKTGGSQRVSTLS